MTRILFLDGPHPMQSIIESTMRRCPQFSGCEFAFRTTKHALHIRGQVKTYYEKQLAQETIRAVLGDHKIVNELVVVPE